MLKLTEIEMVIVIARNTKAMRDCVRPVYAKVMAIGLLLLFLIV